MINYMEGIKKPFTEWKKTGIGFLFYLIPFVNIITSFFSSGYELECSRKAKSKKLPEWKYKEYFIAGLKLFLVWAGYILGTGLLIGLIFSTGLAGNMETFKSINFEGLTDEQAANAVLTIFIENFIPQTIIAALLIIFLIYIGPMVSISFAHKFNFKDAFRLNDIVKRSFTKLYFIAWLVVFLYTSILHIIGNVLSSFEPMVVPLFVGAFIGIVTGITSYTILGQVFLEQIKAEKKIVPKKVK